MVLVVKNPPASAADFRDLGLIPGSGRSPGEGDGNPLQYSCLENPVDRGAWRATVQGSHRVGHDLSTPFDLVCILHFDMETIYKLRLSWWSRGVGGGQLLQECAFSS